MQTIYIDISNKGVIPTVYAKQGDVGRKFRVIFTNSGVPYDVETALFSAWYAGDSGDGNYTKIGEKLAFNASTNRVDVEMITQMLSVPGNGMICIVLSNENQQIGSWNIPYVCEEVPGFESDGAKEYYNAFSEIVDAAKNFSTDKTLSASGRPADAAETGRQLSVERSRVDQLITMRGNDSVGEFGVSAGYITGTLRSNGCNVYAELTVSGIEIEPGAYHETPGFIGKEFAPLGVVLLKTENADLSATLFATESDGEELWAVRIYNNSANSHSGDVIVCGSYPLESLSIPEVHDIRVGYDGEVYSNAGTAVRSQVSSIESAFDVVKAVGNNILDPTNSENANRATDSSMTVTQNDNRRQTIEPIPVDRSKSQFLYLCTTLTDAAAGANVQILWLDESGAYIGNYTTAVTAIIGTCLKTTSIPSNCTQIYVQTSGAKPEYGGNTLDTLCVSQVELAGFEAFGITEQSRTLKPSALPEKVAPTNGKKMLIFGDSITETATMDDDGSNYTPNVKENWPVFATEMLQITDYRNYAKSGATIKTDISDASPRSNLASQLRLALGDELIPDIVVISMGINDAKDGVGVNDTYETAMQKTELSELDSTKFHEALRYAMWTLRITYPKSMMFIATPIQRNGAEPARTVRRGIIDMAERYNFKVIDAMYESGIIRENTDTFLEDDLHPNADGVAMMARLYSSNILSSYLGESYY